MAQKKAERLAITAFADHEVITPPNKLKHVVGPTIPNDDPIARAEDALSRLSSEVSNWMDTESQRLDSARDQVRKVGLSGAAREALFHAAHDIKGEAATFGFPIAAEAANSLCRLIEHTPDETRVPLDLIDQHVDAVRAIIREHTRPEAEAIGWRLATRLREVTDEFLRSENRDRLEEFESILAPPLSPD